MKASFPWSVALALLGLSLNPMVARAELPIPCVAGGCGLITQFIASGSANATSAGNVLTVNQLSDSAILNWQSFNISPGSTVNFVQPDAAAVALNRIFQFSPAQIFGALNANGRVYLLNQNGIVFGGGASVNVGSLIASSLAMTPAALAEGIAGAARAGQPAFAAYSDQAGVALRSGSIAVQQNARIAAAEGGSVLMFAPEIFNQGTVQAPGGQALLAAGAPVYLTTSSDPNLRGLLVEVGVGGPLTNGTAANANVSDAAQLVGQIVAERGNVTLAGLAVNQLGRVSATTSIAQNGSVYLQARHGGSVLGGDSPSLLSGTGGDLRLGPASLVDVALAGDGATAVDATEQVRSQLTLDGRRVIMESGATIRAPHGAVSVTARDVSSRAPETFASGVDSAARIYLSPGARIDVSGAEITRSMESNVFKVELRGSELADSPVQRDGALRGQSVSIDSRAYGTRDDGSAWQGSPIGDLSGWLKTIKRDVAERSLTGGSISLLSQGDVILAGSSLLDISGGSIAYQSGYIGTTTLMGADGKLYDIGAASRDRQYSGTAQSGSLTLQSDRWGVTEIYQGYDHRGRFEPGYVEGKDAGSLAISAQRVIMDGEVQAGAIAGRLQRQLPQVLAATNALRPYDQLPLAGQLILGNVNSTVTGGQAIKDFQLGSVDLATAGSAPVLHSGFDPWQDVLDGDPADTLRLRAELFGTGAVGRLVVRANDRVALAAGRQMNLGAGGSIDIKAGAVRIDGQISAPSGRIGLASIGTLVRGSLAGGLLLGRNSLLDTAGRWVNDLPLANDGSLGREVLTLDGGAISLTAEFQDLVVNAGARVDASAGARLNSNGRIQAGRGGNIELLSSTLPDGTAPLLQLDGELRSAALNQGGQLTLSAAAICVAGLGVECASVNAPGTMRLAPSDFQRGGFGSYVLRSNFGGIEFAANTMLDLRAGNLLVGAEMSRFATGARLADVLPIGRLDELLRRPVNFSATVAASLPGNGPFDSTSFAQAGSLLLARGASIIADSGAAIALRANSRLLIDGNITAPAGAIGLQLDSSLPIAGADISGYFAAQGIWLGDSAQLLARGVTRLIADDSGRISGDVLAGGSVAISAQRGHVLASRGSLLDVSGISASLDVRQDAEGRYARTTLGSAGGSISVRAAEAIVLGGRMQGQSGDPGVVAGASLSLRLDPTLRDDSAQSSDAPYARYPDMARSIDLSAQGGGQVFGNSSLPVFLQGRALLGADQIVAGGFDALALNARSFDTVNGGSSATHLGRVLLAGDLSLALGQSLSIDAAMLESDGGVATLAAPRIRLGHSDLQFQSTAPLALGTGSLAVASRVLEVQGVSVLRGLANAELVASEDLRLSGLAIDGRIRGSLSTGGALGLAAAQIYPTTLSEFAISAGTLNNGTLAISRPAGASAAQLMSAGGVLRLSAPRLIQAGTLRAPFGELILDAADLTLMNGSVTATSGAGAQVLMGSTQGGFDWVYQLAPGRSRVLSGSSGVLPSQSIELRSNSVSIESGAQLDVRGGGELLGAEFVAGAGGTVDILSGSGSPGSFAILPQVALADMPLDTQIQLDSTIGAGRSVKLAAADGLPAGEYVVLPARYAVLPGAFLVRQVSGYQDITSSESHQQLDGSVIVAGHFSTTGTGLRDSRNNGFAVLGGAALRRRAHYELTSANSFFAAAADAAGTSAARLPRDAGAIAILAHSSLQLNGRLLGAAGTEGRGATLDIASQRITVTGDTSTGAAAGLQLRAADLNAFGAESVLLGGLRSESASGLKVQTVTNQLSIASGATLTAAELLLVAGATLQVESGAALRAQGGSGTSARQVELAGNGAFLRVAGNEVVELTRAASNGVAGSLLIEFGATLSAQGGAINLESTGDARLAGSIDATGGSLSLTGNQISIGEVPAGTNGFALTSGQLSALDLEQIVLHSRGAIDFHHSEAALRAGNIALEAQVIRSRGGAASVVAERNLLLTGVSDALGTVVAGAEHGNLQLTAANIHLGAGSLRLLGFDQVSMAAESEWRALSDARLEIDGAAVLSAQRFGTASGVDASVRATGALELAPSGNAAALPAATDLGGRLSFSGQSIKVSAEIKLPSGSLELRSTAPLGGGVLLSSGASIDLAGLETTFDRESVSSGGGRLSIAASSGDVVLDNGSIVDVTGAQAADAGSIALRAAQGAVQLAGVMRGGADSEQRSGSLSIDAGSLPGLDALAAALQQGGFGGELNFRQRGAGDLIVGAGTALQAESVSLTADAGLIRVDGAIRAQAGDGGRIRLSAAHGITLRGLLDASSGSVAERNGRIDLQIGAGSLRTAASSSVATVAAGALPGSAGDGRVNLRAPREALLTALDADTVNDAVRLQGDWSGAGRVSVEGFRVYTDDDGVLDATNTVANVANVMYADTQSFAGQAVALGAALNQGGMTQIGVLPGIEIRAGGDLALASLWDLSTWRFNLIPGVLSLRAAGDLNINQSLNEGFAGTAAAGSFLLTRVAESWSYRLAAGADLSSADVLAVQDSDATGSLRLAAGDPELPSAYTLIRTGTGSIDIRAARDVELGNSAAMIYSAGTSRTGTAFTDPGELDGRRFPRNGGDISIVTGRDIVGADSGQLVTDWLWRVGNSDILGRTRAPAWTVAFGSFRQNVATLGGGDLTIRAGRNIDTLSVSAPTAGFQNGGTDPATSALSVTGGGAVRVSAVGDILGGAFYAGLGSVQLDAGGAVGRSTQNNRGIVLALGNASARVRSAGDIEVQAVVNPSLLPQGASQTARGSGISLFSTYGAASRVSLDSLAGDIRLLRSTELTTVLGSIDFASDGANITGLQLYPAVLQALAQRGNIAAAGVISLLPSATGFMSLRAHGDVSIDAGSQLIVSDVDPSAIASQGRPLSSWSQELADALLSTSSGRPVFNATVPVRRAAAQTGTLPTSRIVAQVGDVRMQGAAGSLASIYSGGPIEVHAGRDVLNLNVTAQNLTGADVSSVSAGRDIRYSIVRAPFGNIVANPAQIAVDGPGQLLVQAGRSINLQNSAGISTRGALRNPALSRAGAAINVLAGVNRQQPDYAAFASAYLRDSDTYVAALSDYLLQQTGARPTDRVAALALFSSLTAERRGIFLQRVLMAELKTSGRAAASVEPLKSGDYSAGFRALELMFPGSNPEAGADNRYAGDLALYFSRIYTLAGGDITLLAPGGGVNAGLATPPAAFGVAKSASELGIVAQSSGHISVLAYDDLQVNESRVFAADGGDILVWATRGDIDAGRGAKTAVSAPPPVISVDANGRLSVSFPAALTGSGIQTLATSAATEPGDVDLFAPRGVVNAGDAGIVAGNLTIGATAVLGADNIDVSGVSVGVPADTGGLGASLQGVSALGNSAASSAGAVLDPASRDNSQQAAPLAAAALSWLEVFVLGLGEEICPQDDLDCLKRQSR